MKLQNKKTGEIGDIAQTSADCIIVYYPIVDGVATNPQKRAIYNSLAQLNEEWEDYEEPKSDTIDFSNVRLPVVEIHRKVRDCSNEKADLIISLDQETGVLTYRVVNKELGYDFVYTPLEFSYVAWTIIGEDEE